MIKIVYKPTQKKPFFAVFCVGLYTVKLDKILDSVK